MITPEQQAKVDAFLATCDEESKKYIIQCLGGEEEENEEETFDTEKMPVD